MHIVFEPIYGEMVLELSDTCHYLHSATIQKDTIEFKKANTQNALPFFSSQAV